MPETPASPPEEPIRREISDDDYVRLGHREIIAGIILIAGAVTAYWWYTKDKPPVMKDGAVYIFHEEAKDEGYKYLKGPDGTEVEVVETKPLKEGKQRHKILVRLTAGEALDPGEYSVVVVGPGSEESKYAFTVKVQQKAGEEGQPEAGG